MSRNDSLSPERRRTLEFVLSSTVQQLARGAPGHNREDLVVIARNTIQKLAPNHAHGTSSAYSGRSMREANTSVDSLGRLARSGGAVTQNGVSGYGSTIGNTSWSPLQTGTVFRSSQSALSPGALYGTSFSPATARQPASSLTDSLDQVARMRSALTDARSALQAAESHRRTLSNDRQLGGEILAAEADLIRTRQDLQWTRAITPPRGAGNYQETSLPGDSLVRRAAQRPSPEPAWPTLSPPAAVPITSRSASPELSRARDDAKRQAADALRAENERRMREEEDRRMAAARSEVERMNAVSEGLRAQARALEAEQIAAATARETEDAERVRRQEIRLSELARDRQRLEDERAALARQQAGAALEREVVEAARRQAEREREQTKRDLQARERAADEAARVAMNATMRTPLDQSKKKRRSDASSGHYMMPTHSSLAHSTYVRAASPEPKSPHSYKCVGCDICEKHLHRDKLATIDRLRKEQSSSP